jgi:hypothetical protein
MIGPMRRTAAADPLGETVLEHGGVGVVERAFNAASETRIEPRVFPR